jgi:tetratricopeptide (TPR) repeat protein
MEYAAKALTYSDRAGDKEQHYIRALSARMSLDYESAISELESLLERYPDEKMALFTLGDIYFADMRAIEEGISYFLKTVEVDPLHQAAYNSLSYAYNKQGDFEKALWAINKYITIAPNEPNPYDTRGDIYAMNGKVDQAIESYKQALEISPGFVWSVGKLGNMYRCKRDYEEVDRCFRQLCTSPDDFARSWGRYGLGVSLAYQGRFEEALRVLDDGIGADRMDQTEGVWLAAKHILRACIYQIQGNPAGLTEVALGRDIWSRVISYRSDFYTPLYVEMLVESGDIEGAEKIVDALERHLETLDRSQRFIYWEAAGEVEWAKGNTEIAVANLEKAVEEAEPELFYPRFALASAYVESRRLGEAVTMLEELIGKPVSLRIWDPIREVKCHYLLGRAYEESGWTDKAVDQYNEFLEIWKNADPGIPEVEDARQRLNNLEAS